MKNNNHKTNTVLLTVIGIATLLIAVIGATFAYFTAQISGNETVPTIQVGAGTLMIEYEGGTPQLHPAGATEIVPQETTPVTAPFGAPIITKEFSLTGNNSTDSVMPYTLAMVVNNNTFRTGSLKYTLTVNSGVGRLAPEVNYSHDRGINTTVGAPGTVIHEFCGSANPCAFLGRVTNQTHSYTLRIYFPSFGNMDDDKGKAFAGYISTGVEAAYTTRP